MSAKIVHLAEQANLPVLVGSQAESSVGALAAAHIDCAFKQVRLPSECFRFLIISDSLLKEPVKIENGILFGS